MLRTLFAAATLALIASPSLAEMKPTGLWLTEKQGIIVRLYDCGANEICGRTVWLKKTQWKDGSPRIDEKNPNPALRERPWCGIEVIKGLKPSKDGGWDGGSLYDPKTGKTYDFMIEQTSKGLKVRGYLGAPLLGKSERWTPAPMDAVTFCDPV